MLKKNEEYVVEIIDNGFQGEGIAKIDGITVFVQGAIKNERVKIKIIKVLSDFCFGKMLEIIEKSEYRIEEDCATYKQCGGCNLRHIEYEETLNMKRQIVENCLKKANIDVLPKVQDTIGMDNPKYYRNKLQYPLGLNCEGRRVMGVYANRTHDIVPVDKCFIQNEECQNVANSIFEFIRSNNIFVYDEKTLRGLVRHIVVRIGIKTNEIMAVLVLNHKWTDKVAEEKLIEHILSIHPNVKTIVMNINGKDTNVILGDKNEVIYGNGYIYDVLGDFKFKISVNSFYQVNPIQTEILYNEAISYIDEENKCSKSFEDSSVLVAEEGQGEVSRNKKGVALDLYCGIGTIGIFASKHFKKVYGIETIEQAVEDAKENARLNNVENIEFFVGDVEQVLPEMLEANDNIKPDVVFVDPPRKGMDNKTIETILMIEPKQIIYISCNPATLARDISKLQEKYKLEKVRPTDMFPYTSHVECVCSLKLKQDS
ncbi:MAG: 23S rRNA (uracil(1939)-C(5))-methyltransferase RlmD [Oscillospiraceae bacterium]|nr:23S rRNA (uracil(1939)-C(5))-methyltransferase RlmD [Oscillospiraceae bacterium]